MSGSGNDLETSGGQGESEREPIHFASALTSFAEAEHERLARYLELVDKLVRARLWQAPAKFTMTWQREEAMQVSEAPWDKDPEGLDAMMPRFRNLYASGRSTAASFPRALELIRSHVAVTTDGQRLAAELAEYESVRDRILETTPMGEIAMVTQDDDGNVVERRVITPKEALEDWMYGEHLHDDEVRLERLKPWRAFGVHRNVAVTTAWNLTQHYHHFAVVVVKPIVEERRLLFRAR